jgi:RsiW-degrading membrane proteinase PrsW (M82 family)
VDGSLFDRRHANEIIRQSREGVAHVWADVRSFQFKWIVPYETVFSTRIVRNPVTWVTLLFGFAPLLAGFLVASQDQLLAWLLTYFALAWAAYFYTVVAKRATDLPVGLGTAGFTTLVGFQIVLWLKQVPPLSLFYGMITQAGFERLLGFVFGVALNEELVKALPVLLLAFYLRRIEKPLDGIFYGAMSGLGFALREASHFIVHAQNANAILYQALLRTTTLPFLHATWTGISGYFIALAIVSRHRRAALCVLGIAVAATLHGSYDFASEQVVSVGIAAFVYLLFISYIDRSQDMVQELEKTEEARNRIDPARQPQRQSP